MEIAGRVLLPIIWPMEQILGFIGSSTGSYGLAIVCLSVIVRVAISPITRHANRVDAAEQQKLAAMQSEIALAKRESSGRERFERIDRIYAKHNYHPIHSLKLLLPLALQIPFLLAALYLLLDYAPVEGERFLMIRNLGAADGLIEFWNTRVNALPITLTLVAIFEAFIRPGLSSAVRIRFLVVAVAIAFLIYPLPAGVCLYWMTNNVWSLSSTIIKNVRR